MLKLMLQYFGHLMQRANSLEKTLMLGKIEDKRRRGQQRMRWLESITDSTHMNLSELRKIVDREAWWAADHGVAKSQTGLSNWTATGWLQSQDIYAVSASCVRACLTPWAERKNWGLKQHNLIGTYRLSSIHCQRQGGWGREGLKGKGQDSCLPHSSSQHPGGCLVWSPEFFSKPRAVFRPPRGCQRVCGPVQWRIGQGMKGFSKTRWKERGKELENPEREEEKGGWERTCLPQGACQPYRFHKSLSRTMLVWSKDHLLICERMSFNTQNLYFKICPTRFRRKRNPSHPLPKKCPCSNLSKMGWWYAHYQVKAARSLLKLILLCLYLP